jgi:mannose/fructose/N-acetylgalactosamine-specific phosphotransferase system component IIC
MELMDLLQLAPLVVLGAVLGLDVVSFPQAMISRPIVASTLAGALIGHADRGLLMGVALEFFALESMPFGASRYPEWGSAAVVGGALFAHLPPGVPAAMSVAALAALVTAGIGGWSMVVLRRWNAYWARRQQARIATGSGSAVVALQLAGMTSDFVRGGILTFVALVVFEPIHEAATETVRVSPVLSRAFVVAVASTVGLAAVWKVVHSTAGARWYLLGGLVLGFGIAGSLL